MVVDDFHVCRVAVRKAEAAAPLDVDPDAVLANPVSHAAPLSVPLLAAVGDQPIMEAPITIILVTS